MRAQYKEKNPEVSSCILHYDIVWVNCYFNEIPYGSEGRVLDVCPPRSGTDVIHYLVEIPVYTQNNKLITVYTESIPSQYLELHRRWDSEKNIYVKENLETPVITFNVDAGNYVNQFGQKRFTKN